MGEKRGYGIINNPHYYPTRNGRKERTELLLTHDVLKDCVWYLQKKKKKKERSKVDRSRRQVIWRDLRKELRERDGGGSYFIGEKRVFIAAATDASL